ncbi:MAG: tRNA (adenosine(37)-N6)-dimethylallyltransferase MiaA [Patescibacteria group bacterium]
MLKPKIIVILGQTATGKSDLAVTLAKKIDGLNKFKKFIGRTSQSEVLGEVISADSRQIYKGLNIGTGKITKKEMKGIPHHLLDVATPKKVFSVAEYQKLAIYAIAEIISRGKTPIICGGTGFYIDAITKGLVLPEVPPNKKLRKSLEKKSALELFKILKHLDSRRAKNIDKNNKVRLIRAIEIVKALGKVPSLKEKKSDYKFIKIGLYLPEKLLKKKIEQRVKKMFKTGLLNEIKKLKRAGVSEKRLREFGFEYNKPTPEKVIKETIKYAKRQMTWFKRDKEIKWFDASKVKIHDIIKTL